MIQEKVHALLTEHRLSVFGIALIWIFFRHTYFYNSFSYGIFDYIVQIGDIGVDVFMFLSAYGLCFSYKKNNDKKYFYKRRLLRILPSVFALLFVFALVDTFVFGAGLSHCINPLYWFNSLYSTYWFIGAIILFYAVFPFLYEGIAKLKCNQVYVVIGAFLVAVLCVMLILRTKNSQLYQLVVYSARIPILIIGMLMATTGIWKQKYVILCLIISIPLVYILPKDFQRISYSLLAVPLVYFIPFILDKLHPVFLRIFTFVGVCSLEFYLIHIYLLKNNVLGYADGFLHSQILASIIVMSIVVVCSFFANRIIGLLTNSKIVRRNAN